MNSSKRFVRRSVNKIAILEKKLRIGEKKKEVEKLQQESSQSDFWQDSLLASKKMKRLSELKKEIESIEKLRAYFQKGQKKEFDELLKKLELRTLLSGKYDESSAILSLHAGQGGTEAQDWAEMLKRMYLRFIEKQEWQWKLVEETYGEEAGIKRATILVSGLYAYGYLKREGGTHRLVRLSPFNADHLRQTSFALVEVLPEIEETESIPISESDLEWEFFRASSHG